MNSSFIPHYPESVPLALAHKPLLDTLFHHYPPETSELTFTNLYSWNSLYQFKISKLGDFFVIVSAAQRPMPFLCPLGSGDTLSVIKRILQDSAGRCIRVPEFIAQQARADGSVDIIEDRDNADYVFRITDLVQLAGRKYDGKRNLIRKFKSSHRYEYIVLDPVHAAECAAFAQRWCMVKECDKDKGLMHEKIALDQMLENFGTFKLIGGAILINKTIAAIALAEPLNPETLVLHMLKADPNVPGLYQTINQEFLARQAHSFTWVNFKQDLGVLGLRKAKMSYQPTRLVMKYTLQMSA